MQVCSIQGNSFQGVYKANNFSPTPVQERMIKTIKDNFVKDTVIYRKGKNFHDFMESRGLHFLLSNGDYQDEIKVEIAASKNSKSRSTKKSKSQPQKEVETAIPKNLQETLIPQQNCGSFPENRLDSVVDRAKEAWKDNTINTISFIVLGVAFVAFGLFGICKR